MASTSRPVPIAAPNTVPEIIQELVLSTGPTVGLNVSTGHCAQVPVAVTVPVNPGLHKQASICVLPTTDTELAGHVWQVPGPRPTLYPPAAQIVHAPPFAPVYPALHWQAVAAVLSSGDVECSAQSEHTAGADTQASVVRYFPEAHWVQAKPLLPENPALHRQAVCHRFPAGELEF